MPEIADAVLTLRTDDTALASGLDQAEARTMAALRQIEGAVRGANLAVSEDGVAAISAAVLALAGLNGNIVATSQAARPAAANLENLAASISQLGLTSLASAAQVGTAISTMTAAAHALVRQAAAIRAASAASTSSASASTIRTETRVAPAPRRHRPSAFRAAAPQRSTDDRAPLVGALHVTVERENPRAVQSGVERALEALASRAVIAGAID